MEEQTRTVEELRSQIREINRSELNYVQELMEFHGCDSKQDRSPSGISEELRRATVQKLERAAARQELRTKVQEAITKNQTNEEHEEN